MSCTQEDERVRIGQALGRPLALIPDELLPAFHDYQNLHCRRFLLLVNLLGQGAFLFYAMADMLIVPDIAMSSLTVRVVYIGLVFPLALAGFRWCRDIRLLDLLLPVCVLVAAVLWIGLLVRSISPYVAAYQYASLIFIVLANLCVQVRFLPAMLISLLISAVILGGVYQLVADDGTALLVFCLVYLPVLFFSLFISFSTTLERRRAFLRSRLDDMMHAALSELNVRLEAQAHTDPLTGVSNRRQFELMAEREIARAHRQGEPICVLILDVDHFKRVNDSHGHDVGDLVLRELASVARQQLREHDLLARLGGEEFAALLPNTALDEALFVAQRLRTALSECRIAIDGGRVVQFTVSIGVSRLADQSADLGAALKAADKALYQAKQSGRNQVCLSLLPLAFPSGLSAQRIP